MFQEGVKGPLILIRRNDCDRFVVDRKVSGCRRRFGQGISRDVAGRFGFGFCLVPIGRAGVAAERSEKRGMDFFELRRALIQPYCKRLEGGGACDHKVAPAVIVDVGCLETESGQTLPEVGGQMNLGTAGREVNADLI